MLGQEKAEIDEQLAALEKNRQAKVAVTEQLKTQPTDVGLQISHCYKRVFGLVRLSLTPISIFAKHGR